ncbi:MAG: exodeoxyribonuclease III [Gammaproteobacteria bacterium]
MLRVISINTNGIRAATRKGFFDWIKQEKPDIICIQETKAKETQLEDDIYKLPGYHRYFHDAIKPGYSGVAIYTKHTPKNVITGLGWPVADDEGRYIEVDFDGLRVASLYMPSGTSGDVRQGLKYEFLDSYANHLKDMKKAGVPCIICGDWNIAHKKIDIKNWRGNQKNSGFLPEERAWMDELFGEMGFVDAFREINQEEDQYTWWSNRGQAWAKNVGWRIDYQVISPELRKTIKTVDIYKNQRFSDHAPLIVDYDIKLT